MESKCDQEARVLPARIFLGEMNKIEDFRYALL